MTAENDGIKAGQPQSADPLGGVPPEQDRLMVLVKDHASVKATASFLERRGVETFVSGSLQDVIDRLSAGWGKYVLLSINYPHPKIDLIPTLLSQSFQAEIMVFAETADRKTNTRLTGSKAKHVIFGVPSGPVVLMRLKQMQREVLGVGTEGEDAGIRQGDGKEGETDQQVRISGSNGGDGGAVHLKGSSRPSVPSTGGTEDHTDALAKLMGALKANTSDAADESLERDMTALKERLPTEAIEQMRQSKQKPIVHIQKGIGRGSGGLVVPPPTQKQKMALADAIKKGKLKGLEAVQKGPNQHRHSLIEHSGDRLKMGAPPIAHDAAATLPPATEGRSQIEKKNSEQSVGQPREHGALTAEVSRQKSEEVPESSDAAPTTLIESCIRQALMKVCGKPREGRETLLEYCTASVVILSSLQFTGSVLIVIGRGTFDHKKTLRQVEIEFLQLMSDGGIDFSIGEMQSYPLDPAPACEDAFFSAEFSAVSRSEELEVGMAYIDVVPVEPNYIETQDQMLEISCDDIEPDLALPFEVYLYLPMNKKYLRYVKNGSTLSVKQSANLKTNEVKNLYVNKASVEAFKQHATVGNLKKKISKRAA